MRGPAAQLGWAVPAALALALAACSTAAPDDPQLECVDDNDCADDEVCLIDQGNVCRNLGIPARRPVLGMEVSEDDFRIEFRGCDAEIDPIDGELRTDPRDRLSTVFELGAISERPTVACADCTPGDTCSMDGSVCTSDFVGSFSVRRSSRLGLRAQTRESLPYPLVDEMMLPTEDPVEVDWARYAPADEASNLPTILELNPAAPSLARFRVELAAPPDEAPVSLEAVSRLDCQRQVTGRVRRFGGSGIEGATVAIDYDEVVAPVSTVLGAAINELPTCSEDEECGPGRACNPLFGRCGLDLRGVEAGRDAVTDAAGDFTAPVYTYCEDGDVDARSFRIRVTPPEGSGLPRLDHAVTQTFTLPLVGSPISPDPLDGDLCLPPWPAPLSLDLPYAGEPVRLLSTADGDYVCCSADCLPTAQEDRPPSTAPACAELNLNIEAHADFSMPDPQSWMDDGCVGPAGNTPGRYEMAAECDAGVCPMSLTPGEGPETLTYTVSLISPPGSVFRSEVRSFEVGPTTTELPALSLQPRVVVAGRIACDAELGEDCSPEDVAVRAERIRMPGESLDTPGPFVHDTTTVADGSYILLVDPGVYVVTALPPRGTGSLAGPAPFTVLDLRLGTSTSLVNLVDGVPNANAPVMQIEPGVPVVLRLRGFSTAGRVRPIDRGSWLSQGGVEDPDGRALDLNDPATCYTDGGNERACEIRSLLRPPATTLVTSISNAADFTMRFLGPIDCPSPDAP